jgi:AraC-like DNA-binding protein
MRSSRDRPKIYDGSHVTAIVADAREIPVRTSKPDRPPSRRARKPPGEGTSAAAVRTLTPREKLAPAVFRTGIAAEVAIVLRNLGVDPDDEIRSAGRAFREDMIPARPSPVADLGKLMSLCVARTECAHFGLLVGQRDLLASLGLVGCLAPRSQTVGKALETLVRHLQRAVGAAAPMLAKSGAVASLSYPIHQSDVESADQIADGAVAAGLNVLRTLCGAEWSPTEVLLPRPPPPDPGPYTRFFRAPVRFGAGTAALIFPVTCLGRGIEMEAVLRRLFAERLGTPDAVAELSLGESVRRVLRTRLLTDECSSETVASLFSMHRRTLSRRLRNEGLAFQTVVNEVRFEIARKFLAETGMSFSQIARALGFSEISAFTRAFRRWSGQTPTAWRAAHRPG